MTSVNKHNRSNTHMPIIDQGESSEVWPVSRWRNMMGPSSDEKVFQKSLIQVRIDHKIFLLGWVSNNVLLLHLRRRLRNLLGVICMTILTQMYLQRQ